MGQRPGAGRMGAGRQKGGRRGGEEEKQKPQQPRQNLHLASPLSSARPRQRPAFIRGSANLAPPRSPRGP